MDRETALKVVEEHAKSDSLRKHLAAVEECMRAYARKEGEDEELWGIAGLVHDFDWEVCPTPESHPTFGAEILRSNGFPEPIVRPTKSLSETSVRSVRRKFKDKRFAASVSREDIYAGAAELGVDLDEHIQFIIDALKPIAPRLVLAE